MNVVLNRTVVVEQSLECGSHLRQSLSTTTAPSQDYVHSDDHTQPTNEMAPGFKPFTFFNKKSQFKSNNFQRNLYFERWILLVSKDS